MTVKPICTHSLILLRLLAAVIGAFGLATVIVALTSDDVTMFLRSTSAATGALLVVAAALQTTGTHANLRITGVPPLFYE